MHETMGFDFWAATAIFVGSYALIITEKVHKTIVAICGGSLILILKVLTQHEAFSIPELGIDWNVIFLLISMMVIVNLMKPTGVFEYVAIKSAKLGRAEPVRLLVIFSAVTAILSAFLDNVTTVLLIVPVITFITDKLDVDPIPFLISAALASNIGGTATLIGDPPNIMIASRAHLDFMDFVYHLTPVILIIIAAYAIVFGLVFRGRLSTRNDLKARVMAMDEREEIKDGPMLVKSLMVLGAVLAGFVFHGMLGYEPATVALAGAGLMMLVTKQDQPHGVLADLEWATLFFFIGLFIIVGAVVKVGLVSIMSSGILALTHGNMFSTSMLVMWFSAFASAFIDNIPYVATMNPLIADMAARLWPGLTTAQQLHHPDLMPVWWSLALGACLGGNGTVIGASANVIVVGMSEKLGFKISFGRFMLYGMPVMIISVAISSLYVWVRYYLL